MTTADILEGILYAPSSGDVSERTLTVRKLYDDLYGDLREELNEEYKNALACIHDVYETACACSYEDGFVRGLRAAEQIRELLGAPHEALEELNSRLRPVEEALSEAAELRRKYENERGNT